jgi:hypothetical protein
MNTILVLSPPSARWGFDMTKPDGPAQIAEAEIDRAIEDAAPDLERYRTACLHLGRLAPGTRAFGFERNYLQELYERIDCRARRIELPDGQITGAELIQFAEMRAKHGLRMGAPHAMRHAGTTDVPPNLAERYRRAITATTDAQRVYNEAESVLRSAQRAELAALEAYRTHGATILVRA